MRTWHVVVTGPNTVVRKGVAATLHGRGSGPTPVRVVAEVPGGADLTGQLVELRPDVLLVLGEPDDGQEIRRLKRRVPVLLGLAESDDAGAEVLRALRCGVSGVVSIDADLDSLPAACEAVGGHRAYLSPSLLQALVAHLAGGATRAGSRFDLTAREQEVLRRLATGMSTTEIAAGMGVARRTVKHHLGSVYRKLRVRGASGAIVLAYREGLVA
jgi:DNA-binding NarL/FixJ family response regulator